MQSRESNRAITIGALATLLAALALAVPLLDRLIDAAWQWYKFAGYSSAGHITLSLTTGQAFSVLLAATFGCGLWFHRLANNRSASHAKRLAFCAMCVTVVVLASYWLLGVSSLNVWRA